MMPIIVFPAARRKRKREKEKGHYAVVASPLQPHLCDKDTARQVTAPVDQEPSEVLQVTGGLSGTIAARGSVLKFWRPSTSVAGSDTLARLAGSPKIDDGGLCPGQMLLWCFPGLRGKRSHDTQRPSWEAGRPWVLLDGAARALLLPSESHCGLITCWPLSMKALAGPRKLMVAHWAKGLDLMGEQKSKRAIGL